MNEHPGRYSAPGRFGHYRAFFEDVERNRALAQSKLGMPVLALGGDHSIGDGVLWATRRFAEDARGGAIERCGHCVLARSPARSCHAPRID